MNSYLEALECVDEKQRELLLDSHAAAIRKHVDDLSKKKNTGPSSTEPQSS
jgi:DNA anti-recombination protein RmuC